MQYTQTPPVASATQYTQHKTNCIWSHVAYCVTDAKGGVTYIVNIASLIVCDGASSNLSIIKASHETSGVYPIFNGKLTKMIYIYKPCHVYIVIGETVYIVIGETDPYVIGPFMMNPFNPSNPLFQVICPTHQVMTLYC